MVCPYCQIEFEGVVFEHHLKLCPVRRTLEEAGLTPAFQDLEDDLIYELRKVRDLT